MTQADAIGESSRVRYVPKFPRRTTRHRPLFKISLSSDVMRLIQFTTRDIALVFHLIVKVILNYNIKFEKYNIQRLRKDFVQFDKSPTSNSVRKSVGTVFIYLFIFIIEETKTIEKPEGMEKSKDFFIAITEILVDQINLVQYTPNKFVKPQCMI